MIKRSAYIFCMTIILLGCATSGPQEAKQAELQANEITAITLSENAVEVHFSNPYPPTYTMYKPSDPYTVVVDITNVVVGQIDEKIISDKEGISEVSVAEGDVPGTSARMTVLLEYPSELVADYAGNILTLTVAGSEPAETSEVEPAEEPGFTPTDVAVEMEYEELPPAETITGLSFDNTEGYLRFVISGDGSMFPNIFSLDRRIVIDIPDVMLNVDLPEQVVPPVKSVRKGVYDDRIRFVLDLNRKEEFAAEAVGDSVIISFTEVRAEVYTEEGELEAEEALEEALEEGEMVEAAAEGEMPEDDYEGKLISLDFQEAEIKPIIRLLAGDVGGYNVVLHPSVSGKTNLKLKDVPWDKALDIILKQTNFGRQSDGNIMYVAPTSFFIQQQEAEAKSKQTYEKVAELKQERIHLEHIAADDMMLEITKKKALTPRGQVDIDERTNSIDVTDTEETIRRIKTEIIPLFDNPEHGEKQVLIEAKLVFVRTASSRTLGISWGGDNVHTTASGDTTTTGFGINAPAQSAAVGSGGVGTMGMIMVGTADSLTVSLSLQALETLGHTRSLANPRVMTRDRMAASITQGTQVPYTVSGSEGPSTEFQSASLSLSVTPTISRNNVIQLQVSVSNNSPGEVYAAGVAINTQSISTQALVKDGDTLVLGGIYKKEEIKSEELVPWFGRIPILGWFFTTLQATSDRQEELLIFITPKIIGTG
jgi:type IV pilus secretin PilQ/predicted competence protein